MTTPNPRVIFAKIPEAAQGLAGLPLPGEHLVYDNSPVIDLENVLLNGGFLTKMLVLSPEPALRERMRDPKLQSYTTPFILGAPVIGFGIVIVLRSEKEGIKVGDYMYGQTPWEVYTVQPYIEGRIDYKESDWPPATFDMDSLALQVVPNPGGAFPLTRYASLLGTPGLSAYVGFEGLAEAAPGKTIFVSAGASGVGSMVVQLSKLRGMKVIASAGTDEKVEYLKSLGADVAFNYRKESYSSFLAKNKPFQVYWDNVGGEALEAAIEHIEPFSHIVCCGSLGDYQRPPEDCYGIKNIVFQLLLNPLRKYSRSLPATLSKMFFQTTIVAALASLAVATPLALRTDSRCNTESVKCCNKSEDAETFKKSALAALIPIEIGDITGKVYSQCSPIVGLIGGSSCSAQTVCCDNAKFNGLVNIGCTPINVAL